MGVVVCVHGGGGLDVRCVPHAICLQPPPTPAKALTPSSYAAPPLLPFPILLHRPRFMSHALAPSTAPPHPQPLAVCTPLAPIEGPEHQTGGGVSPARTSHRNPRHPCPIAATGVGTASEEPLSLTLSLEPRGGAEQHSFVGTNTLHHRTLSNEGRGVAGVHGANHIMSNLTRLCPPHGYIGRGGYPPPGRPTYSQPLSP